MNSWFDPIIFSLGPLQIRWYGVLYVLAFFLGSLLLKRLARSGFWPLSKESIDQYVIWLIIGMFFGARLMYVFVYNWSYYSENLGSLFSVWKGGLSFHGAVVGMCLSTWIFARKHRIHFYQLCDCMAVAGTPGLFLGRVGNFINGELYGRVTGTWFGMIFPGGGPFPRHPSQLYEGILEGILLAIILYRLHKRERFYGVVSSVFVLGYGSLRFFVEFFREPDSQLGLYRGYFSLGQILCALMIPVALLMLLYAKKTAIKNPLV